MGKKKKADRSAAPIDQKPALIEDTQPKKQKASTEEIDDIFNTGKRRKVEAASTQEPAVAGEGVERKEGKAAAPAQAAKAKAPQVVGNKDDIFGQESTTTRKKTEEGFFIYTEDELGMNKKGGDTDLCPFDCDCCF